MSVIVIAIVVGLLGVGLAASQLMRLKTYLNKPPSEPTDPEPPSEPTGPE